MAKNAKLNKLIKQYPGITFITQGTKEETHVERKQSFPFPGYDMTIPSNKTATYVFEGEFLNYRGNECRAIRYDVQFESTAIYHLCKTSPRIAADFMAWKSILDFRSSIRPERCAAFPMWDMPVQERAFLFLTVSSLEVERNDHFDGEIGRELTLQDEARDLRINSGPRLPSVVSSSEHDDAPSIVEAVAHAFLNHSTDEMIRDTLATQIHDGPQVATMKTMMVKEGVKDGIVNPEITAFLARESSPWVLSKLYNDGYAHELTRATTAVAEKSFFHLRPIRCRFTTTISPNVKIAPSREVRIFTMYAERKNGAIWTSVPVVHSRDQVNVHPQIKGSHFPLFCTRSHEWFGGSRREYLDVWCFSVLDKRTYPHVRLPPAVGTIFKFLYSCIRPQQSGDALLPLEMWSKIFFQLSPPGVEVSLFGTTALSATCKTLRALWHGLYFDHGDFSVPTYNPLNNAINVSTRTGCGYSIKDKNKWIKIIHLSDVNWMICYDCTLDLKNAYVLECGLKPDFESQIGPGWHKGLHLCDFLTYYSVSAAKRKCVIARAEKMVHFYGEDTRFTYCPSSDSTFSQSDESWNDIKTRSHHLTPITTLDLTLSCDKGTYLDFYGDDLVW